jgi:hypothetical protein
MKVVSMFQTVDGKTFTSKAEAQRHENEHEALAKLRSLLNSAIQSELTRRGNIDNVLRNILLESSEVRNILATYAKKTPKETPKEAVAA